MKGEGTPCYSGCDVAAEEEEEEEGEREQEQEGGYRLRSSLRLLRPHASRVKQTAER